jgi:hypothetical protein
MPLPLLILALAAQTPDAEAEARVTAALSACERVMREGPMPMRREGIEGLVFDPARDVWFWQGERATVAVHTHIGHRWCAAYLTRDGRSGGFLDVVRAWSAERGYRPMGSESLQFGGRAERWRFEYRGSADATRIEFLYTADSI